MFSKRQPEPSPAPPPTQPHTRLEAAVPVETERIAYQRRILTGFQEATAAREAAIRLVAHAERLMLEACERHDELRLKLRRVSEGGV